MSIAVHLLALLAALQADPCPTAWRESAVVCEAVGEGSLDEKNSYRLFRVIDDAEGGIYDAAPYNQTGVALYRAGEAAPFWTSRAELGFNWFDAPRVFEHAEAGRLLVVRESFAGTGAFVVDHLFIRRGDAFSALAPSYNMETGEGVVGELAKRLPEGLAIWKGVAPDYETLSGSSSLWRPDDANCCPTGGTIHFRLQLNAKGDALTIRDFTIEPFDGEEGQ